MSDRINVGDNVDVDFVSSQSLVNCVVLNVPSETGDSWILKNNNTGQITYVQLFERMDKK